MQSDCTRWRARTLWIARLENRFYSLRCESDILRRQIEWRSVTVSLIDLIAHKYWRICNTTRRQYRLIVYLTTRAGLKLKIPPEKQVWTCTCKRYVSNTCVIEIIHCSSLLCHKTFFFILVLLFNINICLRSIITDYINRNTQYIINRRSLNNQMEWKYWQNFLKINSGCDKMKKNPILVVCQRYN